MKPLIFDQYLLAQTSIKCSAAAVHICAVAFTSFWECFVVRLLYKMYHLLKYLLFAPVALIYSSVLDRNRVA